MTFGRVCRIACAVAYGLSLGIVHHVQPIAAHVYNDMCSSRGITFAQGYSVLQLGMAAIVLTLPALLARSRVAIAVNLLLGLVTLYVAMTLFATAGNTPYECFTANGWYEDRTSGLDDFEFRLIVVALLSYIVLLFDLSICTRDFSLT
jgi:hypothetical protein